MGDKIKIVLNDAGIREILQSQGVASELQKQALAIATRSGGSSDGIYISNNRANISVRASNKDNSLLKSVR